MTPFFLKKVYLSVQNEIRARLDEFSQVSKKGTDRDIFAELVFCILTPQSRAKSCWRCVERFRSELRGVHCGGEKRDISKILAKAGVRFHNKKAGYIVEARTRFSNNGKISIKSQISRFKDVYALREWLVENLKGIGYKEASHFLRNIGFGKDLAILDRHILKNLKNFGVIEEIPGSLSRRRYLEIENKMKGFAKGVKIPMSRLDLVMWYNETGEIFK